MRYVIEETILEYQPSDLADWKAGQRERWLKGEAPAHVANQPSFHFGEYFVLAHYALLGWQGYRFYALGNWEATNPKLKDGRDALARTFKQGTLDEFRQARDACGRSDGKGEPDIFLVHPQFGSLFLEVKKGSDRISPEQLECLAQIRGILRAGIGIVYLVKAGVPYLPKQHELDIGATRGENTDACLSGNTFEVIDS